MNTIPYSHFLVKLPNDLSTTTLEDILNNDQFSGKINHYLEAYENQNVFLTIVAKDGFQKNFEELRTVLIKRLSTISEYLSILYDSQTAGRMSEISNTVYDLEREFRTLIEIVFLNRFGKNWDSTFFKNKPDHNRRKDRDDFIESLNNPLDDRNFKDLSDLVKEHISSNHNDQLFSKLLLIEHKVDKLIEGDRTEATDSIAHIIDSLGEIKSLLDKKGFKRTDIYQHLNSTVSSEWNELYDIRNLWAHNNCLLTEKELTKYRRLYNSVMLKIRTEISLLSLFKPDEDINQIIGGEKIKLSIIRTYYEGVPICQLKGKIIKGNESYDIKKVKITYKDIVDFFETIIKVMGREEESGIPFIISTISRNPFLKKPMEAIGRQVVTIFDGELENKEVKIDTLLDSLEKEKGYQIDKLSAEDAVKNDDLDGYLRAIFST